MEKQQNISKPEKSFFIFLFYRIIVAIIILLTLTGIKFLSKSNFKKIKKFYQNNITVNITADYYKNLNDKF